MLLGLAAAVLALVTVIAGGLAWLLMTENGRDFALARAEAMLPEGTSLGRAEGILAGPLVLRDVRLVAERGVISIGRVGMDWSPAALLSGRLEVGHLRVRDVDVVFEPEQTAGRDQPTVPALPSSLVSPVPVRIGQLAIDAVQVDAGSGPVGPFSLALAADHDGERITLDAVELRTPWAAADGTLGIGARRPFPLEADIDWQVYEGADRREIRGTLGLRGNPEMLRAELSTHRPERLAVEGTLQPLAALPAWDLTLDFEDLDPSVWHQALPAWPAGGSVRVHGDAETTRATGGVSVRETPVTDLFSDFDLHLTDGRVRIDGVDLRTSGLPGRVRAEGVVDLGGATPAAELSVSWSDLAWPAMDAVVQSPRGRLQVAGTADAYRIEGSAQAGPSAYPPGDWQVALAGGMDALEDLTVRGEWMGAGWSLRGDVAWDGPPRGAFELDASRVDPERFDVPIRGTIDANAAGDWTVTDEGLQADVRLSRLSGRLAGERLAGEGAASIRGDSARIRRLRVTAGSGSLDLDGQVLPTPDLAFALAVDDLAKLVADARGEIRATGHVSGELTRPGLELELGAEGVAWQGGTLESARIEASLPTDLDSPATIDGRLVGLDYNGRRIDRVDVALDGTAAEHAIDLRVQRADDRLTASLAGGFRDPAGWEGELRDLRILPAGAVPWSLETPAGLRLTREQAALDEACVIAADRASGRACLEGAWSAGEGWRADAAVTSVALAPWVDVFAPDFRAEGEVALQVRARGGPSGGPEIEAELDGSPGRLEVIDEDAEGGYRELVGWQSIRGRADVGDEGARMRLDISLAPVGHVEARLEAGRGQGAGPQPIDGHLRIASERLPRLAEVVPAIGRIEGALDVDLDIGGNTDGPTVDGTVALADGMITLPEPGLTLSEVEVDFRGAPDGIRATAGATSGEGRLEIEAIARRGTAGWDLSGTVDGTDFRAIDVADARVDLSPSLEWTVEDRDVRIDGTVVVPWARVTPREPEGVVGRSRDVEIVGPEAEEQEPGTAGWRTHADVRVELGDDVRFDGFGLTGRIAGTLQLRDVPGEITRATGEISIVDGTYSAYRQELSIVRGRLIYDGGVVTDPGLDIRAERRPRNVVVGVQVRGTLREPDVSLFSEPDMQESQILSYLVLGIPLGEAGEGDRSALASAMTGAGGWIAEQVGGGIGIDDVSVREGATQEETELILGTYLHPRLYVSYGVGLFEDFSRLRLRYSLGRNWAVEAESGPSSSGDLIYSIER